MAETGRAGTTELKTGCALQGRRFRSFGRGHALPRIYASLIPAVRHTSSGANKPLSAHTNLFKMSHCLMYRIDVPQIDDTRPDGTMVFQSVTTMSLYFRAAVWASLALCVLHLLKDHLPRYRTGAAAASWSSGRLRRAASNIR
jgi:hypothetical protein